jgi:hypothetical protein
MLPLLASPFVLQLISQGIQLGLEKLTDHSGVQIPDQVAPVVVQAAAQAVAQNLSSSPVVVNAMNCEPFWQSRIFWAQVVGIVTALIGPLVGHAFSDVEINLLVNVCFGLGGVVASGGTLYFRFFHRNKPPLFASLYSAAVQAGKGAIQ